MLHQHILLLCWTIVADFLIIFGKYFKGWNRYFDVHSFMFFVIGVATVILSFLIKPSDYDKVLTRVLTSELSHKERVLLSSKLADTSLHKIFSYISIFFIVVQTILGLIIRYDITSSTKKFSLNKDITIQRRILTITGIWLWVIIRICLFTGTKLHEISSGSTFLVYLIVETVIAILLFIIFEIV